MNAARLRAMESPQRADGLIRLLHSAARDNALISVTMDTRKWYVGYVAEGPNLNPEEKFFRILPVLSGYRDSQSLEARPTIFYEKVWEACDPSALLMTLPLASVKSANLFDPDLYDQYFSPAPDPPQSAQPDSSHNRPSASADEPVASD